MKDFAVFILTNGRPGKVITYDTLIRSGYTGKVFIIIDNLDKYKDEYIKRFGDKVRVFDKVEISKKFDTADNFDDMRSIVYARNASFDIAEQIGVEYFLQLDDDYKTFLYRFDEHLNYNPKTIKNLDAVFNAILDFYKNNKAIASVAISQGGDFIGGENSEKAKSVRAYRKAMNSFFCSTKRRFNFVGRINEDVNTYTHEQSKGLLFLTTNQVSLDQLQTQSNSGGMTELYLSSGTYVKSFYSVIFQPSSVKVTVLRDRLQPRLHHSVEWDFTVPKILREL